MTKTSPRRSNDDDLEDQLLDSRDQWLLPLQYPWASILLKAAGGAGRPAGERAGQKNRQSRAARSRNTAQVTSQVGWRSFLPHPGPRL